LLLPLAEVRDRKLASVSLQGGEVHLRAGSCAAKFQAAELVSFVPDLRPEWLAATQRQLRAWGGPFESPADAAPNTFEWPIPIATLPLRDLASLVLPGNLHSDGAVTSLGQSLANVAIDFSPSPDGAVMHSSSGIELPGKERAGIRWRVKATLPSRSYFVVTGDGGSRVQPPRFRLMLKFAGGGSATSEGRLGEAVDLRAHAGRVLESVALRFDPDSEVNTLSLAELALFSVKRIAPAQGVDLPTPGWHWVRGRASDLATGQPGRIQGIRVTLGAGVPKEKLAAVRVDYRLSGLPRVSCWLTVEIAGGGHIANARVCPTGLSGTSVVAAMAEAFDAFPANHKITHITWRIAEGAFSSEALVTLRAHHALMVRPSVSDAASQELAVGIRGSAYVPHLTAAVWEQLVKGPAWVHYPGVNVSEGRFHAALSNSLGGAFQVKEWRLSFSGAAVAPQRLTVQQVSAAGISIGRVGKLSLALVITGCVLGVLLWARSRHTARFSGWSQQLQLSLDSGVRHARAMSGRLQIFVIKWRQPLNLVAPALAWGSLGLALLGVWASADRDLLTGAALLTMFSTASNVLRWRTETVRWRTLNCSAWLAGSNQRPPLGLWLLVFVVMVWVALVPALRELASSELVSLIDHVGPVDVLPYVLPLTMLRLVSTLAEPDSLLLWMALGTSLLPWVGRPLARLVRVPGWYWVRLLLVFWALLLANVLGFLSADSIVLVSIVLLVWPAILALLKPRLAARYPAFADCIFRHFSSMYACGGMAGIALAAALLAGGMQVYAAAVANLALVFLLIAVFCLMWEQGLRWRFQRAARVVSNRPPIIHR
jgi:hypothetical protein